MEEATNFRFSGWCYYMLQVFALYMDWVINLLEDGAIRGMFEVIETSYPTLGSRGY